MSTQKFLLILILLIFKTSNICITLYLPVSFIIVAFLILHNITRVINTIHESVLPKYLIIGLSKGTTIFNMRYLNTAVK